MKILLKLTVVKDMKVLDGSNDRLVSNAFFKVIRAVFTTALIFRF